MLTLKPRTAEQGAELTRALNDLRAILARWIADPEAAEAEIAAARKRRAETGPQPSPPAEHLRKNGAPAHARPARMENTMKAFGFMTAEPNRPRPARGTAFAEVDEPARRARQEARRRAALEHQLATAQAEIARIEAILAQRNGHLKPVATLSREAADPALAGVLARVKAARVIIQEALRGA